MSFDILPTELKQMIFKKRYDCMKDDKYKKTYNYIINHLKCYFKEMDKDDKELIINPYYMMRGDLMIDLEFYDKYIRERDNPIYECLYIFYEKQSINLDYY